MTNEQIKDWITEEVKKNPERAEEYKRIRLTHFQSELKTNEMVFNKKGYIGYRSPLISQEIISLREKIREIEMESAEEQLILAFTSKLGNVESKKDTIEFIKGLTDEDHYVEGVFKDTEYNYIHCKDDLERNLSHRESEDVKKISKIYKTGLAKRDKFVKLGEKLHKELLEDREFELQRYSDLDKRGPELIHDIIAEEVELNNIYCRKLAEISVVDAFVQMGVEFTPKQAEKVKQIIHLHNPSTVELAMNRLTENPTDNIIALARNISEAPAQSREKLKLMKFVDITNLLLGSFLTMLGIVGAATGNPGLSATTMLGVANLGLGASGMLRHSKKTDNLDEKEILVSGCIDDLLNEVLLQETFNQGLKK